MCVVGGLEQILLVFFYILGTVIIPSDFHMFQISCFPKCFPRQPDYGFLLWIINTPSGKQAKNDRT